MLFACALALGCSEEPTESVDNDSSSAATDSTSTADAAADSGSSSGGSSSSSGASSSSGGGKDVVTKKANCEQTLACHLNCDATDKSCTETCNAKAAAEAKVAYDAIGACSVDLCKDVTEGNAAEVACSFDKCNDKLSACVPFGLGETTCTDTLMCLAACTLGDLGCAIVCMQNGSKDALEKARTAKACIDTKCLNAPKGKIAQCITDQCSADIAACSGGKEWTCKQLNQCVSHCPESLNIAKNQCAPTCHALASTKALKADLEYASCKVDKCKADQNPSACWSSKCKAEQLGCFGAGGDQTCQEIVQCINKDCESLGGADEACIEKCLAKGAAWAQDAFIQLEGCFIRNLKSKEAKTAGCGFPYDQDTCINVIVGTFCGNQSSNCFTSQ